MRQGFVDKLELELRAAGERRARPWRIARRQLLAPAVAALGVVVIAVALAATVLRCDGPPPAPPGPRLFGEPAAGERGRRHGIVVRLRVGRRSNQGPGPPGRSPHP